MTTAKSPMRRWPFGVRDIQFQWAAYFFTCTLADLLKGTERQRLE